jgi:hypothetical protein
MARDRIRSRGQADGRYERNIESAPKPKLLLDAQVQIAESVDESGSGVVVVKVVRNPKAKFGLAGDAKSYGCLEEIEAALAAVASLLKSVLELQASTGDDDTRIRDLRSIRGNRALRIGTAFLGLQLQGQRSRHDVQ